MFEIRNNRDIASKFQRRSICARSSLSSRTAVTGQIKLAFKNVNGKSMITTRSVQASLKSTKSATGATVTFKTLEGQLAIIEKAIR